MAAGGGALLPAAEDALPPHRRPGRRRSPASTGAAGAFRTFLLHGVTGSGKTEVYLQAIAAARAAGKGALVLVPGDRAHPAAGRPLPGPLRRRGGAAPHRPLRRGSVTRSGCGCGAARPASASGCAAPSSRRCRTWASSWSTRSTTRRFKQEDGPRYHARDLAVVRAREEGAVCVLGSATPSLETLENARRGKYRRIALPRPHRRPAPARGAHRRPARPHPQGAAAARAPLARSSRTRSRPPSGAGQQAILFLNRRGFQTLVLCRDCGARGALRRTARSRSPSTPGAGVLLCHYCGAHRAHEPPLPGLRRRARRRGRRHRAGRGGGAGARSPRRRVARLDRDAALRRRRHRRAAGPLRPARDRRAGRHPDGHQGARLPGRDAGRRGAGRHRAGAPRLPRRRADLPAPHPGGRAGRARRRRRAGCSSRPSTPIPRPSPARWVTTTPASPRRSWTGAAALGYPPFGRMLAVRVEGSEAGARRTAEALGEAARPALGGGRVACSARPRRPSSGSAGKSRWHLLFRAADPAALRAGPPGARPGGAPPPGRRRIRFDVDPHAML